VVKLVALDMDGTLLDSSKRVPSDFIPWVKEHRDILPVIASGRQYYTLLKDFSDIRDEAVFMAENGAFIVYRDEIIHTDEIEGQSVLYALDWVTEISEVYPLICGVNSIYYLEEQSEQLSYALQFFQERKQVTSLRESISTDTIIKLALYVPGRNADDVLPKIGELENGLYAVVTGPEWIDILKKTVNKGVGLGIIQNRFGISRDESMGFGDLMNDYEMLKNCRYSFAMENACDGIRKVARFHTASNDEDGVMKVLRDIERYNGGEEQT